MKPYGLKSKKGAGWPLSENLKSKKTARQFADRLIRSQRDIEPEIAKIVQEHFMELL